MSEIRTPPPQPRSPAFQPRFTVGILYLLCFFFVYATLLVLPELLEVLAEVPPGPEQELAARDAAQEAASGRIWIAVGLTLATVIAGAYYRVLPGMR